MKNGKQLLGKYLIFISEIYGTGAGIEHITFCGFVSVCPLHNASIYNKC